MTRHMNNGQFAELASWITQAGLAGQDETATLTGVCERLNGIGMRLARANIVIDTLHPVYQGRAFTWKRLTRQTELTEFGRSQARLDRWERSPFYQLEISGAAQLRRRLSAAGTAEFPLFADLIGDGMTDYLAIANRFSAEVAIGDLDCVYSSWACDGPGGLTDNDVADLTRLAPILALTMKSASLTRIANTLAETYLGRDAGRKVLEGRIQRGVTERIEAVLWYSDLRNYTKISDSAEPDQIIPLLNEYAEAILPAIHAQGGDVLKLIGDGTLAIFPAGDRAKACHAALDAAAAARQAVTIANHRRAAEGLPTTDMYLGLHVGDVFYGNIGSRERLDFTVVGPAVNEVSRIANMCRSVDQPLLISSPFAAAIGEPQSLLVSVGRYALRGVAQPQELFTLDQQSDLSE